MSEQSEAIHAAVAGALARPAPALPDDDGFDRQAWCRLQDLDFTAISASSAIGGAGGDLTDAAAAVGAAAFASLSLPEATFLAGPALSDAGIGWPDGVTTAAVGPDLTLDPDGATITVSGTVAEVAWGRAADHVVLLLEREGLCTVVVIAPRQLDPTQLRIEHRDNIAGEARDTLVLDRAAVLASGPVPAPWSLALGTGLLATARAVQIAAAARAALVASVRHTSERVQFGKTLDRFQAVQHQLAHLVSWVVTAEVAAQAATVELTRELDDARGRPAVDDGAASPRPLDTRLLVAAAKSEASSLAGRVAAAAHQLHGAIGFTTEHHLGRVTTRLWAWRDEHGNENVWDEQTSALLLEADRDLWGLLTGTVETTGPTGGHT